MEREQLIVRITPDGSITAETKGMKGPRCLDTIRVLEDLLEAQTTYSTFTDDYHEIATAQETETDNELHH